MRLRSVDKAEQHTRLAGLVAQSLDQYELARRRRRPYARCGAKESSAAAKVLVDSARPACDACGAGTERELS